MQVINDDGTQRTLEQYELDALNAARDAHEAEQAARGVFVQWGEARAQKALLEIVANSVDVPLEQAVHMQSIYPAWSDEAEYTKGFRVSFAGSLWTCLQDHVSQAGWMPTDAPSLWAKVLLVDTEDGTAPEWVQPDSTNAYNQGDRVTFDGKTYVSTIANNVWSPADYPQGWEELND